METSSDGVLMSLSPCKQILKRLKLPTFRQAADNYNPCVHTCGFPAAAASSSSEAALWIPLCSYECLLVVLYGSLYTYSRLRLKIKSDLTCDSSWWLCVFSVSERECVSMTIWLLSSVLQQLTGSLLCFPSGAVCGQMTCNDWGSSCHCFWQSQTFKTVLIRPGKCVFLYCNHKTESSQKKTIKGVWNV